MFTGSPQALIVNNNLVADVTPLRGSASLNTLVLSHNKICKLPKSVLRGFPGLLKLSISDNQLAVLPDLSPCPQLAELRAVGNRITVIPDTIAANGAQL